MAIQQVGSGVSPAAVNPPGRSVPQGADAALTVSAPPVSVPPPQPSAASSLDQMQQAMKHLAEIVQSKASNLEFSLDTESGTTVVKVVDNQTKEVIRQIPSEEMLNIAHAIDQMQGMLIKRKA
jgi:flagellar protein FlaG